MLTLVSGLILSLFLSTMALPAMAQDPASTARDDAKARIKALRERLASSRPAAPASPANPHLPTACENKYGGVPHPHCKGALYLAMDPQYGDPMAVQAILTTYPDHAAEMQRTAQLRLRMDRERQENERRLATRPLDEHTVTHTWRDSRGVRHRTTTTCTFYQSKTECHTR